MDLATAQTYLNKWIAAQEGLASNAAYTVSFPNGTSRTVTRAEDRTIRNQITYWHRVVNALDANAQGNAAPARNPSWS